MIRSVSISSASSARLSAFSFSGRLRVMRPTLPITSVRKYSYAGYSMPLLLAWAG